MDQFLHRDHKMRSPRINRTTIWLSVAIFPWKNTNFAQLVGHFRHAAVGGVPETVSGHNTMPSLFISQSISPSTVSSRPHWEVRSRNTPTAAAWCRSSYYLDRLASESRPGQQLIYQRSRWDGDRWQPRWDSVSTSVESANVKLCSSF